MSAGLDTGRHPCFNVDAKGTCGRVHIPVARQCNIKCNYCNRKYDCPNESRPGVTSGVLTPEQAVSYLEKVLERAPQITVAGIAGPGDAFATPTETLDALRLIRERFPNILLCLASNGLNLAPYVPQLAQLNVSHVTVTVNAVDPEIGAKICAWIRDGKKVYRGIAGAQVLLERQLEAIRALKACGVTVKINTIVVPGINDHHVPDVSRKMAELGVDIQNCMVMYPNQGTPFQDLPEPTPEQMSAIRKEAGRIVPQMLHCTRCRADAVGLLDDDRSAEFRDTLNQCSEELHLETEGKPYVAVATLEGLLINQHLGEADRFQIWGPLNGTYELIEERDAPARGDGINRWLKLAELLHDCRAVLASAVGETPRQVLEENKILPIEMNGLIKQGLEAIYTGGDVSAFKRRRRGGRCGKAMGCMGAGDGCG